MGFILGFLLGAIAALAAQFVLLAPPPPAPQPPAEDFDVEVRLREPFLTGLVRQQLQQTELGPQLQDVQVDALPGRALRLVGRATIQGTQAPISATIEPRVVNGLLRLEITELQLGGTRLPPGLAASLDQLLNERLQQALGATRFQVVGVATDEQSLILRLRERT
ncbi:MAG: hypothetical protein HY690_17335 [Chloroflexi bacterium]|nr:hypothetical protein [Chloroflexota bacterium]